MLRQNARRGGIRNNIFEEGTGIHSVLGLEEVIKGLVLGKDMCDDQEQYSLIRYRRHQGNGKELERNKKERL